jgi:hypothetical protein
VLGSRTVETFLVGLLSLVAGAVIKTAFDRHQATWLKRRDAAVEAYGAAVAVHSAVVSSLAFVRRVDARARAETRDIQWIAETSDWHLCKNLDAERARLEKLREQRLNIRSIWGADVARLFDDFFDIASAWHNAFATWRDEMNSRFHDDDGVWDHDVTGFVWNDVIAGTAPHADAFDREFENQMNMVRRFASSAGAAVADLVELPPAVREVLADYEDHRARRPIMLPAGKPDAQ